MTDKPTPAPTPPKTTPKTTKTPIRLQLFLAVFAAQALFINTMIMATGGGKYVLNLFHSLGGWGALFGVSLLAGLVFLFPPLFAWFKARKGPVLAWCLAWNVGFLAVFIGFAPVKPWFQAHGAMAPALLMGENSWLVREGFVGTLAWGTGSLDSTLPPAGSEPFIERSNVILATLKEARSLEELKPVVADSNLQTVAAWSERKQLLALRHVNNKIELLDLDAETLKREWRVEDFEQSEQAATLIWHARDPEGGKSLVKVLKLVKEGDIWKADFADDITEFDEEVRAREKAQKPEEPSQTEESSNPAQERAREVTEHPSDQIQESP